MNVHAHANQHGHAQHSNLAVPPASTVASASAAAAAAAAAAVVPKQDAKASSLLDEFRHAKKKSYEISDIRGHVAEFARDQHGSRFIQQKLESASPADKPGVLNMLMAEILPCAKALMTDVFGNYVVQKLLEHGLPEHQALLFDAARGSILELTLQMYGCRVVQKALETLPSEYHVQILAELKSPATIARCIKDQNGNHVIQKLVERVDFVLTQPIIEAFQGHVVAFSRHAYGCRVVQRILEHGGVTQRQVLLREVIPSAMHLAQDQYGNYVVQHVLEHGTPAERSQIVRHMMVSECLLGCATHKFASNVIEKCYAHGSPDDRRHMLDVILEARRVVLNEVTDESVMGAGILFAMMKDQYANYVVQKMMDASSEHEQQRLVDAMRPLLGTLRKFPYAKHIIARLEKLGKI
jgi:hypothetical protein